MRHEVSELLAQYMPVGSGADEADEGRPAATGTRASALRHPQRRTQSGDVEMEEFGLIPSSYSAPTLLVGSGRPNPLNSVTTPHTAAADVAAAAAVAGPGLRSSLDALGLFAHPSSRFPPPSAPPLHEDTSWQQQLQHQHSLGRSARGTAAAASPPAAAHFGWSGGVSTVPGLLSSSNTYDNSISSGSISYAGSVGYTFVVTPPPV